MGMLRVWDGKVKTGKSQVKQSFKDECDINNIMKKYRANGTLPRLILENPQWGDFSEVPTYLDACRTVIRAQEQFAALDVSLKNKFRNNPEDFLAFVNDPKNKEELYNLGLAIRPVKEDVQASEAPKVPAPAGGENA